MKVSYFANDLFMSCLEIFHNHGHEIAAIFTSAVSKNNQQIRHYAASNNILCITDKPNQQHIKMLDDLAVDCFFSIEYEHLIPLPARYVKTLNMHPTMLPQGRGATPLSQLILQYPEHAGITFHKLGDRFDTGDIVFQQKLSLSKKESLESLISKLNHKIPQCLQQLLADFDHLYQNAHAQCGGSEWPKLGDQDRLLNWHESLDKINLIIKAFGRFGVIACIEKEAWLVNHIETFKLDHNITAGTQLSHDAQICTIAINNGIVIIYKDSILERRDLI